MGSCKKDHSEKTEVAEPQTLKNWSKLYGGAEDDRFNAITPCGDGTYVAVGYTYSNDGDISGNKGRSDFWIVKMNGNGDKVWGKTYGGSEGDQATTVARTADGGYLVAGNSGSTNGDVIGNHGVGDVWVVKIDGSGNKLWAKVYGGSAYDYANAVIATPDGGSLVVGGTVSNNGDISGNLGGSDMWAVRLDANGNKVWAKNLGTSSDETAGAVAATPDGGYVLVGNYSYSDALVVKVDANGNQQWIKIFGGTSNDYANKITVTADGGYLFVGSTKSNNGDINTNKGNYDLWAVKLDGNGNKVWSKTYGGSLSDQAYDVITTSDKGFLVAGSSASNDGDVGSTAGNDDMWALKLDAAGAKVWGKTFGGTLNEDAFAACEAGAGSFILAGISFSNNGAVSGNHGMLDAWLLKITE
jgi:hypothetical protein